MYDFTKIHPDLFIIRTLQSSCLCVVCENAAFVAKSIDTLKNDVPNNPHDLIKTYSCSSASQECMYGECKVCCVPVLEGEIKSANITDVTVYQWTKIEMKKRQKK